jgi:hypothetical protein
MAAIIAAGTPIRNPLSTMTSTTTGLRRIGSY